MVVSPVDQHARISTTSSNVLDIEDQVTLVQVISAIDIEIKHASLAWSFLLIVTLHCIERILDKYKSNLCIDVT